MILNHIYEHNQQLNMQLLIMFIEDRKSFDIYAIKTYIRGAFDEKRFVRVNRPDRPD